MFAGEQAVITLGNHQSKLEASPLVRIALETKLTLTVKGSRFMPSVQSGRWDGSVRFLQRSGLFPTGLVAYLLALCKSFGIAAKLKDARDKPEKVFDVSFRTVLREEDQVPILQAALKSQRGIIEDPTGCGKTCVFTGVISALGVPSSVVVFSRSLAHQTVKRLAVDYGVPEDRIGLIGDQVWEPRPDFVTVCVLNTLFLHAKAGKDASEAEREAHARVSAFCASQRCVVVDEVHHLYKSLSKFKKVMPLFENAYYRFGFSALPFNDQRADDATYKDPDVCTLVGMFGPPVHSRTLRSAVEQGHIVEPKVMFVDYPKDEVYVAEDWASEYDTNIVHNDVRNDAICGVCSELVRCGYDRILVMLERVEHVEEVSSRLVAAGVLHDTITGPDSKKKRDQRMHDFTEARFPVIVTNRVMREGIDAPKIRAIVLGTGMSAAQLVLQTLGRGVRRSEGKTWVPVFDLNDRSALLKFMTSHWNQRRAFYKGEHLDVRYGGVKDVETFLSGGELPRQVSRRSTLPRSAR